MPEVYFFAMKKIINIIIILSFTLQCSAPTVTASVQKQPLFLDTLRPMAEGVRGGVSAATEEHSKASSGGRAKLARQTQKALDSLFPIIDQHRQVLEFLGKKYIY